jgi:outer membrane protein
LLAAAHIEPVDPLVMPPADELPPLDELVKQALANRSDLATERENEEASRISSLGTRNGVLPNLVAFAGESQAGIAGTARTVTIDGVQETAIPFFTGGLGRAEAQAFQRDFPSERGGAFYFAQLRNRQALADYAIDQLQYRQTQLTTVKDLNQVQVDVLNATIALRQARARYQAAVQNRTLQEQLFESEQKKFKLGASTPYNVIQQQRDLVAAQSTTVAQLAAYTGARISLERTLGTILTANHVSLLP